MTDSVRSPDPKLDTAMFLVQHLSPSRIAVVFLVVLCGASCAPAPRTAAPQVGVDEKLGAQVALDVTLKDEDGKDIALRQLIDKPTILTLNYFRCTGICTPLLNGMVNLLNEVALQPGRDFQVVTLSFDPRDTPEIAHQKRVNYLNQMRRQFPPQAWRFLTGDTQATKQVTDSVGFNFRAEGDQFVHPGTIVILTPTPPQPPNPTSQPAGKCDGTASLFCPQ